MAGKPLNRRELRRQYDAAEPMDPMEEEGEEVFEDFEDEDAGERKAKKKKAPAKPKAKAVKTPKPAARTRIVWTVMSDAFKPIATFPFSEKAAAETKARELTERGKGTHFVQRTKEPMPDNAPGLGASIPRPSPQESLAARKAAAAAALEEDDEIEDEDEPELDDEIEEPEDDD